MHKICDVSMEKNILEENQRIAHLNEHAFKEHNIRAFNVLGAIGSGKTTLIESLYKGMKDKNIGAIAGDLTGEDDHMRFESHGIRSISINTGKDCHLDAHLVNHALEDIPLEDIDYLFIENVGNLICPVDFPLGTEGDIVVISVTEGDDMVRKHPLIFSQADITVLNKVDLVDVMEVDLDIIRSDHKKINPNGTLIEANARKGKGLTELADLLELPYSLPR
ncbi:MAG: hydrogenase nickel incorporation protein HypB [Thermoplasmata archaeon]